MNNFWKVTTDISIICGDMNVNINNDPTNTINSSNGASKKRKVLHDVKVDVPAHNAYLQQQNLELLAEIKKLKEENENGGSR